MVRPFVARSGRLLLALAALLCGPSALLGQGGQITGRVIDSETGQPLPTVQIVIQGTGIGALSGPDASFVLNNVPPGTHTLLAQRIGYQQGRETVTVGAGQTARVELMISPQVLALQGIVATGLIDPVEGVRSPITVARVTREHMPVVVAGPAVQNLQGRVAGVSINRQSGLPGDEVTIMLRTPTSVTGTSAPLIVVDGVILGTETSNIESLDIESIEVIKGAAAASLYGSRAAAGVISITTARGQGLEIGRTRFSARTEFGRSEALRGASLPTHHQYLMDPGFTTYVDLNGNPVPRTQRVAPPPHLAFMDKPYPGPVHDNLRNIYQGGNYSTQTFSMMQNGAATNFAITVNRLDEAGPLTGNEGYERNTFRLNLDHRFRDHFSVGVSSFHSRDWRDNVDASFATMLRAPADIDLRLKDQAGQYVRIPDPTVAYENPLWTQASRDWTRSRVRTLGSANLKYEPAYWVTFSGNMSYDRQDENSRRYVPKGTPTSITQDIPSDGEFDLFSNFTDTWNSEAQVSFRRDFGPMNARTTVRGIQESVRMERSDAEGRNFFVQGVPRMDATANRNTRSEEEGIGSIGYLWDTALDYDGKYIFTVLGRRDGSSLFGPDNRWHNYYRVAGAWRLSEEPWFNLPRVDELKLSLARGTAGGRPLFAAQYETWNVSATGVGKGTLGNRELRPEHTTEQEVSLNAIVAGRVGIELNYAQQRTTDQLIQLPVPSYTGYASQWSNVGTVTGNTFEVGIESRLIQTPRFGWTTMFTYDRSRSKIAEWPVPCTTPIWRYYCEGVGMYEIWGSRFMKGVDELANHHTGGANARRDEFQVNDDGYLVWVGAGNTFRDGIAKNLWGTSTTIDGQTYRWGMPVFQMDEVGNIMRQQIGDGEHDNFGWINNFSFGNFSAHTHFHAAVGGEIANQMYRTLRLVDQYPKMDQSGKSDDLKKPVAYYTALEGGRGNNSNIEPADYLKLRTASLSYRVPQAQLSRMALSRFGMESMTVSLVGRNLVTFTRCLCPDPEQGLNLNTRLPHLSTPLDQGGYPNSRTLTAEIGVTF
jgi:TonB-linked SusC/RagA family outer membrane protein